MTIKKAGGILRGCSVPSIVYDNGDDSASNQEKADEFSKFYNFPNSIQKIAHLVQLIYNWVRSSLVFNSIQQTKYRRLVLG